MNEHVRTNEIIVGFLCGAAVGVGVALLAAPSSGAATRRQIGTTVRRLVDSTRERFDGMRERFGELRRELNGSVAHGAEETDDAYPCFVG